MQQLDVTLTANRGELEMPYANIGDTKLYYQIYGSELELTETGLAKKPTIVVMHGGPGLDHTFEIEFSRECAPFAQVILFDHRGNGRSIDDNPEHWNLDQWTKDVYDFCQTLGLEKPFIQGVSMGGWVAINFAANYPGFASGIILLDTEAYIDIDRISEAYRELAGDGASQVARKFFEKETPPPAVIDDYFRTCIPLCSKKPIPPVYFERTILKAEVGAHFQYERATFNYLDDLPKITDPVLYLANSCNPCHLLEVAKETAAGMCNTEVKFVAFEDCGLVQHDAKDAAVTEIENFVCSKPAAIRYQ